MPSFSGLRALLSSTFFYLMVICVCVRRLTGCSSSGVCGSAPGMLRTAYISNPIGTTYTHTPENQSLRGHQALLCAMVERRPKSVFGPTVVLECDAKLPCCMAIADHVHGRQERVGSVHLYSVTIQDSQVDALGTVMISAECTAVLQSDYGTGASVM